MTYIEALIKKTKKTKKTKKVKKSEQKLVKLKECDYYKEKVK